MPHLVLALLLACAGGKSPADDVDPPDSDAPDSDAPHTDVASGDTDPADLDALALPAADTVHTARFATSDVCADCHDNAPGAQAMRDEAGREVSPYALWRSSMMANSARDPIWRAQVSAEVAATPAATAAIEAKCLRCHAPMASVDAELTARGPLGMAVATGTGDLGHLARDGVSCAACHQIEDRALGADAGFTGGYTILAEGRMYGPHAAPFTMPMEHRAGFTPTEGAHVLDAGLCGTCHTLEGHTLGADGAATGDTVMEQGTWLEWSASGAAATCQDCHLPLVSVDGAPIVTAIARNPSGQDFPPVDARQPYGRHLLVGGNTLGPSLFMAWRDVLQPAAPDAAFAVTQAAARDQLAQRTATLTLTGLVADAAGVHARARVASLVGHKLPTGIPVRRLWLTATLTAADGQVVDRVGAWDDRGRLIDRDGAVLASELAGGPVVGHLDAVAGGGAPQVWEGVLADPAGLPTWRLTRAAGWYKDDRLLPAGFDAASAEGQRVPPVGVDGDADFAAGADGVGLTLDPHGSAGPWTLRVSVVYQPLSARWAAELVASDTPEARALAAMLAAVSMAPEVVATAEVSVP